MPTLRSFPTRGALRRPSLSPVDVLVGAGGLVLLYVVIRVGRSMGAPTATAHVTAAVSTDPANLPYDAARSLLRMFIALAASVLFTFVYGTAAARSRRARIVLLPMLDILQSVPVLGFLTVTVTFFIALFPHSVLGLECASIFAIFTSQAWNLTFSFYHSLVSQPKELDEASRLLRLTKWQRFWRLDVPSSMIGLVWNGMMSFGGGWFFLAASEAITVAHRQYALPGIGSYVAAAELDGRLGDILLAIVAMVVLIVGVNALFWRPLVAWAEKFRVESSSSLDQPRSATLDLLRRSRIPGAVNRSLQPGFRLLERATRPFGLAEHPLLPPAGRRRAGDVAFTAALGAVILFGVYRTADYIGGSVGFGQLPHCLYLGLFTFLRVTALLIVATAIWVPIGVKIGMSPRLSRYAQPVVQILAGFPANLLFPFAVAVFLATGISLEVGGTLLMALGSQWYILFNVIAGASAIPADMRELSTQFRLPWRQKWRQVILPAIFPSYVTGGITAAGGAWNAAIVAEVVTYHHRTLVATGLGAYIYQASHAGDVAEVLTGVIVMSFYVVVVNRLVWRRLYRLADTRYAL